MPNLSGLRRKWAAGLALAAWLHIPNTETGAGKPHATMPHRDIGASIREISGAAPSPILATWESVAMALATVWIVTAPSGGVELECLKREWATGIALAAWPRSPRMGKGSGERQAAMPCHAMSCHATSCPVAASSLEGLKREWATGLALAAWPRGPRMGTGSGER